MSNFDEWENEFVDGDWHPTALTVERNRVILREILQIDDDQEICNFVLIAQVHPHGLHTIKELHRGVIITSLDDEDVESFVIHAVEKLL